MRKQRAFATLTEEEINQIADWLRNGTYEAVLERVTKPRPEGFGVDISIRPLQVLHGKTNQVAKINACLESGEKLTLARFDAIIAGETPASEKVHDAIMEATYEMATSGENTPSQLLSLQRLADFPARVEIREQRAELDHKKFDHKVGMDTFRKDMAEKRFDLAQKTFAFRQQQHQERLASSPSPLGGERAGVRGPSTTPKFDDLGPLGKPGDWESVGARCRKQFNITPHEIVRRSNFEKRWKERRQKLQQAQPSSPTPPAPTEPRASASVPSSNSITDPSAPSAANSTSDFGPRISDFPSVPSVSSTMISCLPIPEPLAIAVDAYTVRRAEEYETHRRTHAHLSNPPLYVTEYRHCPCGNPCPCPDHESEEFRGPFREWFWSVAPHEIAYAGALLDRGLPYRDPNEPSMNATAQLPETLTETNGHSVLSEPADPLATDSALEKPELQNLEAKIENSAVTHLPSPPYVAQTISLPSAATDHSTPTAAAINDAALISTDHSTTDHLPEQTATAATEKSKMDAPTASSLQSRVDSYAVRRAHEYWDWYSKVEKRPNGDPAHEFLTQYRHCPCGNPCPCPIHENGERTHPFERSFWAVSPHCSTYVEAMNSRELPYRNPTECVPKQFQ